MNSLNHLLKRDASRARCRALAKPVFSSVTLIVSIAAAALFGGCGGGNDAPRGFPGMAGGSQRTAAVPVEVAIAQRDTISNFILGTTTLEPERAVDVVAKVSGVVVKLLAEEGDVLRAGQILAQIDDREPLANLKQTKARYENAQKSYDRAKEMFEKNLASKEAYEQARLELETSEAQYEASKLQWEYTRIRAPIDGVITQRNIDLGDMVNVNTVVFSMADFDPLLARVHVPEKDISAIHVGQVAKINVESAPQRSFTGRVQMISPVVDPATGTVKVTVEIHKRDGILRPGMFASVYLLTETRPNALVIPKKALVLESERDMVFKFEAGRAREVPVKLGFANGENVEILAGLSEGDTVITVGQEGLREGIPLRVTQPGGQTVLASAALPSPDTKVDSQRFERETQSTRTAPGRRGPGVRGMPEITKERLAQFEQHVLKIPEIKKAYEQRMKDQEFAQDLQARARFLLERMREYRKSHGFGPGR